MKQYRIDDSGVWVKENYGIWWEKAPDIEGMAFLYREILALNQTIKELQERLDNSGLYQKYFDE